MCARMGLIVNLSWSSRGQMRQQEAGRMKERPCSWGSILPFACKPPFLSDFRDLSQVGGGRVGGKKDPI